MNHLIFASHGALALGMKDSVSMIAGSLADHIETRTLQPGQSPLDLYEELKAVIENSSDHFVILCDVLGGSVHTALAQLSAYDNVVLLSGMNLSMALDTAMKVTHANASEINWQDVATGAKEGITILQGLPLPTADENF